MKTFTIVAALAIASPGIAQAQTYVELRGGGSWLQHDSTISRPDTAFDFDSGWTAGFAVGYDIEGPMRVALEYDHRENDIESLPGTYISDPGPPPVISPLRNAGSGSLTVDSVLLMGYGDMEISAAPNLVPYAGVGVGVAFVDTEFDGISHDDALFAFQLAAGAAYRITPTVAVTVGYSLFVVENIAVGNAKLDDTSHNLTAGCRLTF